jgi:trigger factor
LKIDTQPTEDHQLKLRVEVEADQLESAKRRAARQIAKKAKIPGFRPGKAPYHIIERFAGEAAIMEDALDLLVQDVYPKALDEGNIKPFGPGILENIASTDPPIFEFVVPLEAEVELGDYKSLRLPYEPKEITDEEVNQVLENIREQGAILEPVDRPAQDGDQLQIKLSAEYKQVEEGEDTSLIRERSVPVIIGAEDSDTPEEWPFPGFSSQLKGLSAGDEKTMSYTFEEDSGYESLQGKEAEFTVVVENVKARTLPELTDELAQAQGEYENLEALREDIRKRLIEREQEQYDREYEDKLFEELLNVSSVKYPPQLVEREMEEMIHQLEHRLEQQGMDMDLYLKTRQQDMDSFREELKPVAETRAKKYLVLFEVARQEEVQVDPNEVQAETINTLSMAAQNMSREDVRKMTSEETVSRLASDVTYDLLIRKTTEKLRSIFKGEAQEPEAAESQVEGEASEQEGIEDKEFEGETETIVSESEATPETGDEGLVLSESETAQEPENPPAADESEEKRTKPADAPEMPEGPPPSGSELSEGQ